MAIYEMDEDGVRSFSDRSGPGAKKYGLPDNLTRAPDASPAAKTLPVGVNPAAKTFPAGADGGAVPDVVREFRARNRERRLLQGLPQRTSAFTRRTELQNAQRGGFSPDSYFGSRMTRGQRDAGAGSAAALRQQYADEDALYTGARQGITSDATALAGSGVARADQASLEAQRAAGQSALQSQRDTSALTRQEQQQQYASGVLEREAEREAGGRRRDVISRIVAGLTGDEAAGLAAGELGDTGDPATALEGALSAVEGTQPGYRLRSGDPEQGFLGSVGNALIDVFLGPEEVRAEDLPADLRRAPRPGLLERLGLSMARGLTGEEDVFEGEGGRIFKRRPDESTRTLRSILNR